MSPISPSIAPEDLNAIRSTFAVASRDAKAMASRFYAVLFTLDPSLRSLFHGDMNNQGEKLMSMLTLIVSNLERLDHLLPTVRQLGLRHVAYGVKEAHYATVGTALIEALRQQTGETWTTKADSAWEKAYQLLAENMTGRSINPPQSPLTPM
jgi:hemoglobin-like flavoprotein